MCQWFARIPLIVVLSLATPWFAAAQGAEKHVFVRVLDSSGVPIAGLTADHFAIRESGKERPVVRVEPLRTSMHVAVLVDTSAVSAATDQAFRKGLIEFVEQLAAFNHVALSRSATGRHPLSARFDFQGPGGWFWRRWLFGATAFSSSRLLLLC